SISFLIILAVDITQCYFVLLVHECAIYFSISLHDALPIFAPNFWTILLSVIFIGFGSATFHPEGSRVAYLAAGDRRGLAQSIFQVGGNTGQALAPLITAIVLVPLGQFGAIWF